MPDVQPGFRFSIEFSGGPRPAHIVSVERPWHDRLHTGQFTFDYDDAPASGGEVSQRRLEYLLRQYGSPPVERSAEPPTPRPGLRVYVPTEGEHQQTDLHRATLDHSYPSPITHGTEDWAYVCDCGQILSATTAQLTDWLARYGEAPLPDGDEDPDRVKAFTFVLDDAYAAFRFTVQAHSRAEAVDLAQRFLGGPFPRAVPPRAISFDLPAGPDGEAPVMHATLAVQGWNVTERHLVSVHPIPPRDLLWDHQDWTAYANQRETERQARDGTLHRAHRDALADPS